MTATRSNEDLMEAVRAGRIDDLEQLFERHHRPLYGYALGTTRDPHRAEEAVQETFARILRYRASYRPGAPFVPWMVQIARNVLRAQGPEPATVELERALQVKAGDDPARDLELARRRERVLEGLAALGERDRDLLLLSHVKELPHDEIAALLGISVGAVKVRVHRAIKALRRAVHGADVRELEP